MNNLFLGMLFVFLDFNLTFGESTLGLLPDFVGYILLMKGLEELTQASGQFAKARPWALGMAVYTGALYVLDLFALPIHWRLLSWVLGLASTMVSLVVSYWIVAGILEIEQTRSWDLQGQKLKLMWTYMAVIDGICYVFNWVPVVGTVGAIGAFIMGICFLAAFYQTKKRYLENA